MNPVDASEWVRRYEELRAHVRGPLAGLHAQAWGLTVLVQRGMRGWMTAWQAPALAAAPAGAEPVLPAALPSPSEATVLLANLTLRCLGWSL